MAGFPAGLPGGVTSLSRAGVAQRVVTSVESRVGSRHRAAPTARRSAAGSTADELSSTTADGALSIRLLGPLEVSRGDARIALPASRKARALLAYLALAPRPLARSALAALLWDRPNDPRGELRWSLSKLRGVMDLPGAVRVRADEEGVRLDLEGVEIDALEVLRAARGGLDTLDAVALDALRRRFAGEFLQDGDVEPSAAFSAWLTAQRRQFRALETATLEQLDRRLDAGDPARLPVVERWLALAPFDRRAHEAMFGALALGGRLQEGEEHLRLAMRQFDAEGQDWRPLAHAWRAARLRRASAGGAAAATAPVPAVMQTVTTVPPLLSAARRAANATEAEPAGRLPPEAAAARARARASILVMPFAEPALGGPAAAGLGGALAHDLIARLARLRSLFVIARGTAFALEERQVGAEDAARRLDVDYVASGAVLRGAGRLVVQVRLAETRSSRVLWADEIESRADDALAVLEQVGHRIVAALSHQIELAERSRALLRPASDLDAWEAHHRGLWHMYRFDPEHNALAQHFFELAIRLDPGFARPYAGLSFTHFQNAFLGWQDRSRETALAHRTAAQSLAADEADPMAHWAMGRAEWLRGRDDASLSELEASVALAPNFALGHYTLAFVRSQSGDPLAAIASAEQSRALSPLDPLLFGMLASRAIALIRLGRFDEAADAGRLAAARPNAHVHIRTVAALALVLAGRLADAQAMVAEVRQAAPGYRVADFLAAFRFDGDTDARLRLAAARIGLG